MRKIILIGILTAFIIAGHAQGFKFGLKLSPHFSWFKIDTKDSIKNDNPCFMFSYGLIGDYNFANNYALNFEINHSFFNASTIDNTFKDGKHEPKPYKWKLQNIEIPVALKMKTNEINNFIYYGKFGVTATIKTIAKKNDVKTEDVKPVNIGMVIGGGVHYKLADNVYSIFGLTLHNFFISTNKNTDIYNLKPIYIAIDLGVIF